LSVPTRPPSVRLAYERAIRRSSLPAPARHIALTIATWADIATGVIPDRFQPSLSTLAEATGMGESTVKRHLGVLEDEGWIARDRPDIGKARREHARTQYALMIPAPIEGHGPERAMPRPTAGHAHSPERAQTGPRAGHKSSSEFLEVPEVPLSRPSSPKPPTVAAEPVASERETSASPDKTTTTQPAAVAASVPAPATEQQHDDASSVAEAWRQARGGARVRRTEQAIAAQAAQLLADGHQAEHLQKVAAWMAGKGYVDLERAVTHREAPRAAGVVAAISATSSRPDWCRDPECDEKMRLRNVEHDNGIRTSAPCPVCHPSAVAATTGPLPGTDTRVAGWLALPTGPSRRPRTGARAPVPSHADYEAGLVQVNL
jgi:IclR helix-turn-helix domain